MRKCPYCEIELHPQEGHRCQIKRETEKQYTLFKSRYISGELSAEHLSQEWKIPIKQALCLIEDWKKIELLERQKQMLENDVRELNHEKNARNIVDKIFGRNFN